MFKYEEVTVFRYMETEEEILLAIDKLSPQRKVYIFVIKSTVEGLEPLLKSMCEYLWEHDYCT